MADDIAARLCRALSRLALARQADWTEDHEAVYLEALEDIPIAHVERICAELAKSPREPYAPLMPLAGDIRCLSISKPPILAHADDRAKPHTCDKCRDTGWLLRECPGRDAKTCARPLCANPHSYVVKCFHVSQIEAADTQHDMKLRAAGE